MIRSFIALSVQGEAARQILGRQSPIPGARSVPDEDFHLTLAFLGDQPEGVLRNLADDLDALKPDPFEIALNRADVMGGSHPRVVAMMAQPTPALIALQERITRCVRAAGIDLARRRFRPHVTLYRLPRNPTPQTHDKIQAWLSRQAGTADITFTATDFSLLESRLTPDGPVYTTLADFPFAGLSAQFVPGS